MKKITLLLCSTIILSACNSGIMNLDIMGTAKLDYKPDIENRLGGSYLVPMNPDKVNFDGFYSYKVKTIYGINIEDSHYENKKFLIQTAYTDSNKSKVDAIVVYAIKKDSIIDVNGLTVNKFNTLSRGQDVSQIVWFRKSNHYSHFWSVRVPGNSIKTVNESETTASKSAKKKELSKKNGVFYDIASFGKSAKPKNNKIVSLFTYNELNSLSKTLTKTSINKAYYNCCIKNASFSSNVANKSGGTSTSNGYISMNIDEVPSIRNLLVLPAVITEIHEVKGGKLGNGGYSTTKEAKVLGVSSKVQRGIARALAASFKSVSLPNKEFSKWYVSQMEAAQSRVNKVSASEALLDIGHMTGLADDDTVHKDAHPLVIIRQQADLSKLPENSAYASIEITRLVSDFKGYTGITGGDKERLYIRVTIYDVRRVPPKIQANAGSILALMQQSDAPSLQYAQIFSDLNGKTAVSFINANRHAINRTLKTMLKWKAKDLDIEFQKRKIKITHYDNLGIKAIAK